MLKDKPWGADLRIDSVPVAVWPPETGRQIEGVGLARDSSHCIHVLWFKRDRFRTILADFSQLPSQCPPW
jgi:hypothetical protein